MNFIFNAIASIIIGTMVLGVVVRGVFVFCDAADWLARRPGESAASRNRRVGIGVAVALGVWMFVVGFCAVVMAGTNDRRTLGTVACFFFPVAAALASVGWIFWRKLGRAEDSSRGNNPP